MADFDSLPLLTALQNAGDLDTQTTALRAIKNNLTGHELRKVEYIRGGLVPLLSSLLQHVQPTSTPSVLHETREDKIWIHTANIVGSLAYGGPSFVQPILQGTILASLTAQLPSASSPRLLLAILRCLNVIADNLPLSAPDDWTPDRRLIGLLYSTPKYASCFSRFIAGASQSIVSQQTCDAALALICKTCVDASQQQLLVRAGVLSALAARLASFVVAEGLVIPDLDAYGIDPSERGQIPEPAPPCAHLSPVLETIGLLIETSCQHALELLNHPSILAVLPYTGDEFSPTDIRRGPWGATYLSGTAVPRLRTHTPLDFLLPQMPESATTDSADSFPPLGANMPFSKRRSSSIRPVSEAPSVPADDSDQYREESQLAPWLLYMLRNYRGKRRILACKILVTLFKHDLLTVVRAKSLQVLVTPLLVQAIDPISVTHDERALLLTNMPYYEIVPSILARLIMDDEKLQKVAVDSKGIAKLASCLKTTFDPPLEKAALWRPWKQASFTTCASIDSSLGPGGPSLQQRHTMSYREGLLHALAAIAPFNDRYRQEICDQGVLVPVMLALEPFHSSASVKDGEDPVLNTTGNSASTLLAACDIVRALTRSVTALRTKLVDADIVKAIVNLLHSPDPEVTIAATKVIANLAIDFSPMKPTVSEPALVKKLCEQAHSANARLRLESIWALKHLVLKSTNKLKRDIIDELGLSWIRHLISTDPYDVPPGEVIGLTGREYTPKSTQFAAAGDVIMSEDSEDEEAVTIDAVRDQSPYSRHTVDDDLAIQEQLLDLLRNLFCGENSSEIVEYVLGEIGYHGFIRIIMERLKSKTTIGATRRANQVSSAPPGIVTATLNIVVHLAACQPKFRNMITGNSSLMRLVLLFHQDSDKRIRAAVCWIAINLTYSDNPSEKEACKTRALEMNRMGFLSHMKRMENDPDLDVRERAKTAVHLLEKLIPKDLQR